ncbi:MAG: hypothetical protein IIY45_03760, partial [Firmicutes bacterium]|nr:hypothetical protein [Bacillota bacterium]
MRRLDDRKEWMLFWLASCILVVLALMQISWLFWNPPREQSYPDTNETEEVRSSMISPEIIYISLKGQTGFVGVPDGTGDH